MAIHTGTGVTMGAANGNVTAWLSWVLMIVTGAMNRPGGVWFHPGFNLQFDSFELPVLPPESIFGPGPRSRPDAQAFLGEWPCAVLPDEIRAGNIRAFLNLGGSILTSFPDLNVLEPALRSLDLLVTTEIIANPTTAISTHVLPTKDQLERADVTLWDFLMPRVSAQHTPPVVEPVGDRRSAWWVLAEIGRRLGHDLADPERDRRRDAGEDHGRRPLQLRRRRRHRLRRGPLDFPAPWVEQLPRQSGGWRLAPQLLVDQLATLEPPAPLVLVPRRQPRELNAALDFLGENARGAAPPGRRPRCRGRRRPAGRRAQQPWPAHRHCQGRPAIRRGVVSIPHGHHGANVNVLTDKDVIDPVTGMVRYSGIPVSVEPAPA